MNYENLLWEVKDRIALVTINRPKVLNALNPAVVSELADMCARVESDDSVGALILTGAGDKAFVAGADINVLAKLDPVGGRNFCRHGQKMCDCLAGMSKPVIAAVNGFALGGGCELAMACHMRIASENAKFGQPEVKLGVIPGYAGTQRLSRLVGLGRALEWLLTGAIMDAAEAYRIGLVNRVTPPEELIPAARKLAGDILRVSPMAARYTLEAACKGIEMPLADAQNHEATLFGLAISTADAKEGLAAFLEKRPANFTGK
jgi:enoyl-CoA hydratase